MKILCVTLFFFALASSARAAEAKPYEKLKIYDSGELKSETYYSALDSTNTVRTNFVGHGPLRTHSTLPGSTARIINCPEAVSRRVAEKVGESHERNGDLTFGNLKIKQCILIDYGGAKAYFVEFECQIVLLNAEYEHEIKGQPMKAPIIWVGMETQEGLKDICFYYSYFYIRHGDEYLRADLAGVADIDQDGRHEIVIDVGKYAGRAYNVIGFANGKPMQKEVFGESGD